MGVSFESVTVSSKLDVGKRKAVKLINRDGKLDSYGKKIEDLFLDSHVFLRRLKIGKLLVRELLILMGR